MTKLTLVSAVIPSFNGQKLLVAHLPAVMAALRDGDELLIVDDASTDNSVDWLVKHFSLLEQRNGFWQNQISKGKKKILVSLLVNSQNQRFAASVNQAFERAEHELIWLLNNDVLPKADCLEVLLDKYQSSSKKSEIFAIGCAEVEKFGSSASIQAGKNKLWFEKGLFTHAADKEFEAGETAWVSGGSGIFNKKKWQELAGFDEDFYPAYWEDIDLSFRARQKGWLVLFEPQAQVQHNHETTNDSVFGQRAIKIKSWEHADLFTWKNSTFRQKIEFILWKPYWEYKRFKELDLALEEMIQHYWWQLGILGVALASLLTRFYVLDSVPPSLTWDEAAIGYNGFAVWHARRDEWLHFLPISFQSFGDYKAPLAIYLNGFFTYFLGLKAWTVRLPFALGGVTTILGMGWLAKELWLFVEKSKKDAIWSKKTFLLASTLVLFSPWHMLFSRAGFESGLSLMFLVSFLIWTLRYLRGKSHSFWELMLALGSALAAIYTYHSSKIVLPLVSLFFIPYFWRIRNAEWKKWLLGAMAGVAGLAPFVFDSLWGKGAQRLSQTSLVGLDQSLFSKLQLFATNYLAHFDLGFLLFGEGGSFRHSTGAWGILYPVTIILVGVAIVFWLTKRYQKYTWSIDVSTWIKLGLWIMLMGIVPGALGIDEVPHSNRILLALPGVVFLAIAGVWMLVKEISSWKLNKKIKGSHNEPDTILNAVVGGVALVYFLSAISFLQYFWTDYSKLASRDFGDGYIAAFEQVKVLENSQNFEKVVFTSGYGQPYIFALFTYKIHPIWYQGGSLVKFEFKEVNIGDLERRNTLVVASGEEEMPFERADHLIYGADGEIKFAFYILSKE